MKKSKCLQCGKDAEPMEIYKGIIINTCPDGHRTGLDDSLRVEKIEEAA